MEALRQHEDQVDKTLVLHLQRQAGEEVVLAGKMPDNLKIKRFHPMLCFVRHRLFWQLWTGQSQNILTGYKIV